MIAMKWNKQLTVQQREQYREQQRARHAENARIVASFSPEERKRFIPPMPRDLLQGRAGPPHLAALSLNADTILNHYHQDDLELSEADFENLTRIAVAPKKEDRDFLDEFDVFLADWDGEEEV